MENLRFEVLELLPITVRLIDERLNDYSVETSVARVEVLP